ncbi:MAG: sugar phosphate isomerase/epimerase [Ramlibacter sp.]|nr:sugar phosphate isomerase/epimerase [Ramlibacter sp.]
MRLALCNEVLQALPFERQCALAATLGYTGLELAPFTLADDPQTLDEPAARRLRMIAHDHGLAISSLHWLLVKPTGLSLVSSDTTVLKKTTALLQRLIGFAAACGAQVLVHGSPHQRSPLPDQTVADATARLEAALAGLAPHAEQAGVVYCLEPLSPVETPVINTVAQAAALVDRVGSPALRTMLDVSAASQAESTPVHEVLAKYLASGHIAHVQLNDRNRRGPGQGETPQTPVLRVLHQSGYRGWMAVEPFDYQPDGPGCAAFSAGHVRGIWSSFA